jgi:hypothetical protein
MKGIVGIVAGGCCAIVIACASHQATAVQSMPPQTTGGAPQPAPRPNSPEADQIDALVAQIEKARGLPLEHGAVPQVENIHSSAMSGGTAPVAPTATCEIPKGQSDTCKQSCTLSDSICANAKKICDLAGQMAGDAWAAQKCSDGNATCATAKKQCCECMP